MMHSGPRWALSANVLLGYFHPSSFSHSGAVGGSLQSGSSNSNKAGET